ncbi:MAG: hypothetical protein F7B61_03855 [Caldisphaeraceae archaeon]|nr:hypothetical protein [Caldisphaeraceae archaeon]
MFQLSFEVELTKSKTGLHTIRKTLVALGKDGTRLISNPEKQGRGTYKVGIAGLVTINLEPGEYAVHVILTKNPKNKVRGRFKVYSHEGHEVLEVKYEKLKIRRVFGDPRYSWIVDKTIDVLGLTNYIRRKNYTTGLLYKQL